MSPKEIAERDRLAEKFEEDYYCPCSSYECCATPAKVENLFKEGWNACAAYRDSKLAEMGNYSFDNAITQVAKLIEVEVDGGYRPGWAKIIELSTWWQHSQDKAALAEKDAQLKEAQEKIAELAAIVKLARNIDTKEIEMLYEGKEGVWLLHRNFILDLVKRARAERGEGKCP